MSHYAPFRRKRLRWRRARNHALPVTGLPLYAGLPEPELYPEPEPELYSEPEPRQTTYTQPGKFRPKAPGGMRRRLAYTSLAVLAAASVVVTGLAMTPRTPPPPSGAAEEYLQNRGPEAESTAEAPFEPTLLSSLETELAAALAAPDWPGSLVAGQSDPDLEAVLEEASTACSADPSAVRSCSLAAGDTSRTAAVVGDASAAVWVPALRRTLEPRGWRVLSLAHLDCSLPFQAVASTGGECAVHAETVAAAIAEAAPGLVFVSHYRPAAADDQWMEGLGVLHGSWLAPAARVLTLGSVPEVQDALACREDGRAPADCVVELGRGDASESERSAAEAAGGVFLDPAAWFCLPDGRCPAFAGETPMQQGGALTPAYAARLEPLLGESVVSILGN